MVVNKWWWATMMVMHFVGLSLIIGGRRRINLRIMGFAKELPFGPLHRLLPLAMVGTRHQRRHRDAGVHRHARLLRGGHRLLVQAGALMLLGLNVAVFYLGASFDRVEAPRPWRRCHALREDRRCQLAAPVVHRDHQRPLHSSTSKTRSGSESRSVREPSVFEASRSIVVAADATFRGEARSHDQFEIFRYRSDLLSCIRIDSHPASGAADKRNRGPRADTSGGVLPGVTVEAASPVLIEQVRNGRHRRPGPLQHRRSSARRLHA
jgi:hypothetical protein